MDYILAEACKNSFILYDLLEQKKIDENLKAIILETLSYEDRDDSLILIRGHFEGNFYYATMVVLGMDGLFAEFCGNGSRVCAAYLFNKFPHAESIFLETKFGPLKLSKYEDSDYSIKLPSASFSINDTFVADPFLFQQEFSFQYVEMLEPHLVFKGNISDNSLYLLGQDLNKRKDLFPNGINLNAFYPLQDGSMFVKTYERGVQRLTQSCGTGSISCAAFFKTKGSVQVVTPGGSLEITIGSDGVVLKGPASLDFDSSRTVPEG